ncbi:MAG: hypothetical protein J6K22_01160 [Spirochaetaceae bacterium]|nr:hypothetical protein [Spirochaetaceae bacterium]
MKYFVDIILQGKKFNPEEVSSILGINFRKFHKSGDYNKRLHCNEIEGYGILSSREELTTEDVIDKTIFEYEKIYKLGEENLGIERKIFHLYVECLQNSFSLKTKYIKKICNYFSEMEITILEE